MKLELSLRLVIWVQAWSQGRSGRRGGRFSWWKTAMFVVACGMLVIGQPVITARVAGDVTSFWVRAL